MRELGQALTMDEWNHWHNREILADPPDAITPVLTDLRLPPEFAERYEQVRAARMEMEPEYRMSGSVQESESDAIYRCRSNGSRRGGFGVSRDC